MVEPQNWGLETSNVVNTQLQARLEFQVYSLIYLLFWRKWRTEVWISDDLFLSFVLCNCIATSFTHILDAFLNSTSFGCTLGWNYSETAFVLSLSSPCCYSDVVDLLKTDLSNYRNFTAVKWMCYVLHIGLLIKQILIIWEHLLHL